MGRISDLARAGGRARAAKLSPAQRSRIAREGALARWCGTMAGIPALEVGRRIEARAGNALGEIIRKSYWEAKGPGTWERVCRRALRRRLESSWAGVVETLGRA